MKGRKCRAGITTLSDLTNVAKVFQTDNCLNKFTTLRIPLQSTALIFRRKDHENTDHRRYRHHSSAITRQLGQGGDEEKGMFNFRVKPFREALDKHGIEYEYFCVGETGHDWSTWRGLLYYGFLPNLWKK